MNPPGNRPASTSHRGRRRSIALILAAATAGAACAATAHAGATTPKRGFGGDEGSRVDSVNANWNYNWGLASGQYSQRAEFVPMFWNWASASQAAAIAARPEVTTVLGFNEPERPDQANMTVEYALSLWPHVVATGKRVVSPAVSDTTAGRAWITEFMTKASQRGLRVDAVAFHWYGDVRGGASGFLGAVDWYRNAFNKPVWITEFGGVDWGNDGTITTAHNVNFMKQALPALDARSYVERYAWWNWSSTTGLAGYSPLAATVGLGNFYGGNVGAGPGETLDLKNRVGGNDLFFLQGGTLTDTNVGRTSDSLENLDNVVGTGTITGTGRWDVVAGGRVRVRAGTTLAKTGTNTIAFNGTNVILDGDVHVRGGTLQVENGTTSAGRGRWLVDPGATIALSSTSPANAVNLVGALELRGGTIRSLAYVQSVASPVTLVASGGGFDTLGQLTVNGAIGGAATLAKTGPGVLKLTNATSTYTAGTNVTAGALCLDNLSTSGSVTGAGPLTLAAGTTLAGNATVAGATTVGGTIAPGAFGTDATGTLRFRASLALTATATTSIDLANAAFSDLVNVSGTATLAGKLALGLGAGYDPAYGTTALAIGASGLAGRFASIDGVTLTPTKAFAVTYGADGVYVTVALPGDADLDGGVAFADLVTLAQNYGLTGKGWAEADFTGDGAANFADLVTLAQQYGGSTAATATPEAVAPGAAFSAAFASDWALAQSLVPEPTGLAAIGGVMLAAGRRRRSPAG